MKRRELIKNGSLLAGACLLAGPSLALGKGKAKRLTILHTNDTHSNIDPFPANHAKYPGMGGVSKRHAMIQQIRSEEEHVLLLDAGDIFQGTPYFNKYGGVLEMKLMSKMGYDVATMGNHDFDAGLEGFLNAKAYSNFPFVCANYDFSSTVLNGHTQQHVIIEKGGLKIGIFGICVELKGLVPASKYGATRFLDPIETANEQSETLQKAGCDLVICLSHLGFEYPDERVSDRVLARKTKNIHLILGGHTHTFLEQPVVEQNSAGNPVLINQVGYAGLRLGRIDLDFDKRLFMRSSVLQVK